jgi:alkyldihydroxyacetonephosphate synthase
MSNDTHERPQGEQLHKHRWGFKDTMLELRPDRTVVMTGNRYELSGKVMPELIPFMEEMLAIKLDDQAQQVECNPKRVAAATINQAFYAALQATFPASQYSLDDAERLCHSHGQTTSDELYPVLYDQLARTVDLVFYCEAEADAIQLICLARIHDVCLIPFGGGTSVSSALQLPESERRMIVAVDMRRMNQIEWIDKENYRACVQAGITGLALEEKLRREGFVCGHEPDSIEFSTLGGWIATNASGMKKNRYGNIEEIVENVTLVTPIGTLQQFEAMPRLSIGMQPLKLVFGNEGNLGLITKAIIRIHRLPEVKKYGSVVFPNFAAGVDFLYELTRSGVTPASVRLVDNFQFRFGSALRPQADPIAKGLRRLQKFYLLRIKGFDPNALAAATIVMEGSKSEVTYQERQIKAIAARHGGVAGGEGPGKRGYLLTYAIAYIRDFLMQYQVIGETFETTVPWNKIHAVCQAVAEQVKVAHRRFALPGRPYISARVTQCYHTGVCIYFTYGICIKSIARPAQILHEIEHSLRQVILEAGGSLSHHHGVGKLRKDFMRQTLSPADITLLQQTKIALDPQNIFGIRNNIFAE